jgi:DNA ligase-1
VNRFAALLDRLAYEPRRNGKVALVRDYLTRTPDPERGWALATLTGVLSFQYAKPGLIRGLVESRIDPVLFHLSYDYVGDLSETVALIWPRRVGRAGGLSGAERSSEPGTHEHPASAAMDSGLDPSAGPGMTTAGEREFAPIGHNAPELSLSEVVDTLRTASKHDLPGLIAQWLDMLDETGRWALLKLITGSLRIGVSARLAKTAVAEMGDIEPNAVEEVWHGLEPPFLDLFAWVEGRGPRPEAMDPAAFRPVMLAHAIEERDFAALDPADFLAEWKWDGIRVQAAAGTRADGRRVQRLFSRTGEDISGAFPELVESLTFDAALDGELLIVRDGRVQTFNVLQQRLNRKAVTAKLIAEFPAQIRAYDLLAEGDDDIRALPFHARRARLEAFVGRLGDPRIHLSPLVPFDDFDALLHARADPTTLGAGEDAEAVEGVMLKRRDSAYVPGRPKGPWWKWKRDPRIVDAVLMYAQRGHGRRSSFYSDYTFGVWTEAGELVPVGKAYFGFTDEELKELDRFVRNHTVNRFGPVREVVHSAEKGLVLEVAFEGLQRSTRHKSGVAMRFPRISRIRWDKPPAEADRLETLEKMLA